MRTIRQPVIHSDTLGGQIDCWEPGVGISQELSNIGGLTIDCRVAIMEHTYFYLWRQSLGVRCDPSVAAKTHADELMRL